MTTYPFNFNTVDPSWHDCLNRSLATIARRYLDQLAHDNDWLPGQKNIFNAFSLPINKVNYVLFGESPYPRAASANGYAFWDAAVNEIWSPTGLSKMVNRATSLRNILKMLLLAEGLLAPTNTSQAAIAQINKDPFVKTNAALFANFLDHGFLLLNATPVLHPKGSPLRDARAWQPFIHELLLCLLSYRPQVKLILFGRIANMIDDLIQNTQPDKLYAEHPYNLSFITNPDILNFFRPLHLLRYPIVK